MRILIGDVYSQLDTTDLRVLGIVRNVCRARPKGFQFMPKFRERRWDGYISLMNGSLFPTGLLTPVTNKLRKHGYTVDLVWNTHYWKPTFSEIPPDLFGSITLRPYQLHAAHKLLKAKRGVAKMATNAGKTEVMAALAWAIGGQALVVVHRKELLYQTAERFQERLGVPIGTIGDGVKKNWQYLTVAMIQTLSNIIDEPYVQEHLSDNVILMVDECHNASSDQMMDTLHKVPGQYRFGFSGTPLKYDDLSDLKLISITGRIQVDVTNEDLIDKGYSAEPRVHIHVVESKEGWELEYHDAYDGLIVNNPARNEVVKQVAEDAAGVVLIIVERIAHGQLLNDMIPTAVFVHGSDPTDYRQGVLDTMRKGDEGIFIATSIFDQGVDVPSVRTLIIAAGGKSHIKTLQRVGRGLRKKAGDNVLHVHDFLDDTNKHLFRQSGERISIYEREGFFCEITDTTNSPAL